MHNRLVLGVRSDRNVYFKNRSVELSETEYKIFRCLMENPNRTLRHKYIVENIIGCNFSAPNTRNRYSSIAVGRIRDKLESIGIDKDYIKTVRGIGYMLDERQFHYMSISFD